MFFSNNKAPSMKKIDNPKMAFSQIWEISKKINLSYETVRKILKNKKVTIVGLLADPERLVDIRKNRLSTLSEDKHTSYVDLEKIKGEIEESRKIFKTNNIPIIDVTRKSVEEIAASIIKIHEIKNS